MFISISRIKKICRNPMGGIMFLNQYLKSLKLKYKKIQVGIGFSDNLSLVNNVEFWKCLNENIVWDKINIFDTKISIDNINWNFDYLNKVEIKHGYYFKLREHIIKNSFKNFDIKNVWELSRGYYLKDISLMFIKTSDEKYLKQYENIINSWIDQNPYLNTSNWTNPMEISIRVINWILSFQILHKNGLKYFNQEFLNKYYTNLYQSFLFLTNNIETYPFKSNHYLIDNLGIFILSLSLKNIDKKWIKISFSNILKVLFNQFDIDGVDFENSSNYHLLKLEALMIAFGLYKLNMNKLEKIVQISNEQLEQLHKIYMFGSYLFKTDNSVFLYGDNDETVVYDIKPMKKKLMVLYQLIFNEKVETGISKIFFKSGFSFLKDKDMNICFLRNNTKYSSHFHNDILSFQLNYKGKDFFIDPDTFSYNLDKEKRYYYLSTKRHNTCFVNQKEQSKIDVFDPFLRYMQKKVFVKKWNSSLERDEVALEINYGNVSHLRSLVFNKTNNKLLIFDTFDGKINNIEWNFYLPSEVKIQNDLKAKNILILENDSKVLILEIPEILKIQVQNAYISKKYNQEEIGKNMKLSFENKQKLNKLSFQIIIKENYLN